MAEPILQHARNIYEQQSHNRRMTLLLITSFVLLLAGIGIGFDLFFQFSNLTRLIFLPFFILMVFSGLFSFQKKAEAGLWKKQEAFIEDEEDDKQLSTLPFQIVLVTIVVLLILVSLTIHPRFLTPFFSARFDYPVLQYLPVGTVLSVIIGLVAIFTSLRWSTNSVLWSMNAEYGEMTARETKTLSNVVKEISLAAGLPCPAVCVVRDPDPNAFTIGNSPLDSSIVVTTGLLNALDREELQGVVAHEIAHIRNGDTQLMTTLTILFGAVVLLSAWMKKSALYGGFAGGRIPGAGWAFRGFFLLCWLLTLLLAPLLARVIAMAVSRQREYLADAGGAELTRNPKALARALIKIEQFHEPTLSIHSGIAHLCIIDPLGRSVNSREGWWANLLGTHPPLKKRILVLNAMAYETVR